MTNSVISKTSLRKHTHMEYRKNTDGLRVIDTAINKVNHHHWNYTVAAVAVI